MRDDQRRTVQPRDEIRHREGLAAARHAKQGLVTVPLADRLLQRLDRLRLVAHGLVVRYQFEVVHVYI